MKEEGGLFLVFQLIGEPVQSLVQAVSGGGAGGLDVPVAVPQRMQAQFVCDLCCVHSVGQVLWGEADQIQSLTTTQTDHQRRKKKS